MSIRQRMNISILEEMIIFLIKSVGQSGLSEIRHRKNCKCCPSVPCQPTCFQKQVGWRCPVSLWHLIITIICQKLPPWASRLWQSRLNQAAHTPLPIRSLLELLTTCNVALAPLVNLQIRTSDWEISDPCAQQRDTYKVKAPLGI